jgi:hypothetical protein
LGHLHHDCRRDIRAFRVDRYLLFGGGNHQVHVLHSNSTEESTVPQDQRTCLARSPQASELDWPDVGNHFLSSVRHGDFPTFRLVQIELDSHVFRSAERDRAGIHQCFHLHGVQFRSSRVRQPHADMYQGYHSCPRPAIAPSSDSRCTCRRTTEFSRVRATPRRLEPCYVVLLPTSFSTAANLPNHSHNSGKLASFGNGLFSTIAQSRNCFMYASPVRLG